MRQKKAVPGGELELAVLAAVWDLTSASIRDLYDRVGAPNGLVYTTVAKVVDRLLAKGLLSRSRTAGVFLYRATVRRDAVQRVQLQQALQRIYAADTAPVMATLVEAVESIDPELLDQLSKAVDARRKGRK